MANVLDTVNNFLEGSMVMRRADLTLTYNSKDVSADLKQYLKSFSYTDNMDGTADDLNVTLEDRAELWSGDWLPEKGAALEVSINKTISDGTMTTLPLGKFECDELEVKAPPHEVTIKAVSIPDSSALRGENKNKSWEKVKLSAVVKEIADNAKMEVFYDTETDPTLDRVEQVEESDLSFLWKICKDAGLALKVSDKKVVVFDEIKYEKADPVIYICRKLPADKAGDAAKLGWVVPLSYSFKSKTADVYNACKVSYSKGKDKEKIEYTFKAPGDKKGKMLIVNEQVTSVAEAEALAKKRLREKNIEEITAGFSVIGNFKFFAGATVMLEGFHSFDGKYIIPKVTHAIDSNGYAMGLEARRCLDGY